MPARTHFFKLRRRTPQRHHTREEDEAEAEAEEAEAEGAEQREHRHPNGPQALLRLRHLLCAICR
jgi:hypothetical protein